MKPYLEQPYVNDIGQTINPGDKIIAIASGYCHRINVRPGVYLGVRVTKNWRGEDEYQVVCRVDAKHGWGANECIKPRNTTLQLNRIYALK